MRLLRISAALASVAANAAARERIPVGGQAVIEGVLMKGPQKWGLAVREPGGGICLKSWPVSSALSRGIWKLPIVRGFASMAEMMRVGMRALSLSAEISLGEEEKITPFEMAASVALGIAAVVAVFIAFPMFVSEYAAKTFNLSHVWKNVAEGLVRGAVFVGYVAAIGMWKDIRRVFAYHGAEHKTINAYEHGDEMTPDAVSRYSRIHRRCGTSFLLVVIVVSILVFSLVGGGGVLWRVGSRVVLLPIVIGVSYEFIKGASNSDTWGRICIMPALSLQYITTKDPSPDQIEVAIKALDLALDLQKDNSDITGGAVNGSVEQITGDREKL